MTRVYFNGLDIKAVRKDYNIVIDEIDAKEHRRKKSKRRNRHSKRRKGNK